MQTLLYDIFLFLYHLGIRIAAVFNKKAARWVAGRRDLLQRLRGTLPHDEQRVWFHCASVGEFEQCRPVLERFRQLHPEYKIVLTFFSPSGYELRKNYDQADYVYYLPLDGRRRSARFIRAVSPKLAVFIKYEFWYYYLCNLDQQKVPVLLVSAAFRPGQPFFQWWGGLFRNMLSRYSHFFLQDVASAELLSTAGIPAERVTIAGDTRYDRVVEIAAAAKEFPLVQQWAGGAKLLIAGSTWPSDEEVLAEALEALPPDWKVIIAPHEVETERIREVQRRFEGAFLYSRLSQGVCDQSTVLIIDNIGMLSGLYRYGRLAFVGGGFQKGGIHNTLEPAVFGLPVMFGPVYQKFVEAVQLVEQGFGFPVADVQELRSVLRRFVRNEDELLRLQSELKKYVQTQAGATDAVLQVINNAFLSSGRS